MSNTAIRILVALIGIPCIAAVCLLGGFWIWGMIVLFATVGILELYHLLEKKGAKPLAIEGIIAGTLITLAFEFNRLLEIAPFSQFTQIVRSSLPSGFHLIVVILILFILWVFIRELFRNVGSAVVNLTATVFGVLYVPLFFGTFIGINELFCGEIQAPRFLGYDPITIERWGGMTLLSIFAVIWICDSSAYFGGRAMGRHKLFERISPKKTWEGAIWGLVGAIAASVGAKYLMLHYLTLGESIGIGLIVGIIGQVGDLAESLLKRDAGVKDSSTIIPGHGGVLDRFDSLLFVSPVVYLYLGAILMRQ
jgi:phosphatidate cytidylyltransferase